MDLQTRPSDGAHAFDEFFVSPGIECVVLNAIAREGAAATLRERERDRLKRLEDDDIQERDLSACRVVKRSAMRVWPRGFDGYRGLPLFMGRTWDEKESGSRETRAECNAPPEKSNALPKTNWAFRPPPGWEPSPLWNHDVVKTQAALSKEEREKNRAEFLLRLQRRRSDGVYIPGRAIQDVWSCVAKSSRTILENAIHAYVAWNLAAVARNLESGGAPTVADVAKVIAHALATLLTADSRERAILLWMREQIVAEVGMDWDRLSSGRGGGRTRKKSADAVAATIASRWCAQDNIAVRDLRERIVCALGAVAADPAAREFAVTPTLLAKPLGVRRDSDFNAQIDALTASGAIVKRPYRRGFSISVPKTGE